MGHLYKLDFANGKSYIGITEKCPFRRLRSHKSASLNGNYRIHQAWRKHGDPKMTILAIIENKDLYDAEIKAIKVFNTLHPAGYNMSTGGEISPMKIPEIAAKLNGIKRSEETKAKMSILKKELMKDPKRREFVRKINIGNKHMLGKKQNPEHMEKLRLLNIGNSYAKGHKVSDAAKLKMSPKGRICSEETKEKMRISQNARRAKNHE